jgi:hypothetical protein
MVEKCLSAVFSVYFQKTISKRNRKARGKFGVLQKLEISHRAGDKTEVVEAPRNLQFRVTILRF